MSTALAERRKTYVTVEEAALCCNRSERTVRRWIKDGLVQVLRSERFRSVRVDLDDIKRICAERPDTVHPVRGEIESLKSSGESLEQRVEMLIQQVARLQQRVDLLESQRPVSGESGHVLRACPKITPSSKPRCGTIEVP